eukprot:GHRR01022939.1.p2 GENE.GHRR01022939.1~~GHRR01022939.1.p2  ORF type:complete len:105 (+),score=28.06 GHRR01022939.1:447-761(+)
MKRLVAAPAASKPPPAAREPAPEKVDLNDGQALKHKLDATAAEVRAHAPLHLQSAKVGPCSWPLAATSALQVLQCQCPVVLPCGAPSLIGSAAGVECELTLQAA